MNKKEKITKKQQQALIDLQERGYLWMCELNGDYTNIFRFLSKRGYSKSKFDAKRCEEKIVISEQGAYLLNNGKFKIRR